MLIRVHNVALGTRGEGFLVRLSRIDFEFLVRSILRWLLCLKSDYVKGATSTKQPTKGKKREKRLWKSIKGSKRRNVHNSDD